ncbi:MAG: two-component regulator propeller domain-containing protein [Bacteriovoracaceae bacterium]|nr:histidine kinase [Bacteroidota bacterium]
MSKYCFFLIFFSLTTVPQWGFPQTSSLAKYVSEQWTMDDGLPQSSVNDIIQTRDGYLWLATFGGLVRFDGVQFTVFDRSNTSGMRSDRILTIMEDHAGALWCSTEDGVLRMKENVFSSFLTSDGIVQYSPTMMQEDRRGVLWATASGTPYRFEDEKFNIVATSHDSALARRAVTDPSGVWLAHRKEVLRTLGDSIVLIMNLQNKMTSNIVDFVEYPAGSKTYWLATTGDGIVRVSNNDTIILNEKNGLPSHFIMSFFVDRSGTLWVTAFNGISWWDGKKFVPMQTISGIDDKEMNTLTQDFEENYWTGTPANGLFRLRPSVVTMIGPEQGLLEGKMLSLARRKDGSMIFGTNCGGVYEWKDGKAFYSTMNKYLVNLCVWTVLEDSRGRVWTGARQLTRFDDVKKKGVVFDSTNGFYGLDIFALFEDSKRILWIGCLNGLFRYDGERFTHYTKADGLPHDDVRTIVEDRSGVLWIGTVDGVSRLENGRLSVFPLGEGTESEQYLRSRYVRAIRIQEDGTMWFGTYGGGLIRWTDGRIVVITTKEGLFDNIVSHIVDDGQGNFWMGCNRGIFTARISELNAVADGAAPAVQCYSFGTKDGMTTSETNGGFQPSVVNDGKGTLYFPTVNGVAAVATRRIQRNIIAPPVKIEGISQSDRPIPYDSIAIFPHDSTDISIHYAALSFTDPEKVQYRYMMEGVDGSWVEAGSRRTAYYSNVKPGEWTFRVIASNNDGVWNTVGAFVPIVVRPPFWMSWWFRTVIVLIFLFSGPSIYYIRVTQLEKEKKFQLQFAEQLIESQEQERRRIAADLHDGLGQQILIIKNRVELALKTVENAEQTADQLQEIAESARSSLNDVRSISHGLRPVHLEQFGLRETLLNLCDQVQQSSNLECVYHIDEIDGIIPKEREINFYRIIQEGINNILKHSGATQASMMIRRSDEGLTASLWDNGKGFDAEGVQAGLGLTGIRERTKILGGIFELKSATNGGTTLLITIPIKKT